MKKFLVVFAVLAVTFAVSVAFAGPPIAPTSDLQANFALVDIAHNTDIVAMQTPIPVLARTDYPVFNKGADNVVFLILVGKATPATTSPVEIIVAAESHNNLLTGIAAKTVPKAFAHSNIKKASAWAVVLSDRSAAFA